MDSTLEIVETTRVTKILRSTIQKWSEALAIRKEEHDLASVSIFLNKAEIVDLLREIVTSKVSEELEGIMRSKNAVEARG